MESNRLQELIYRYFSNTISKEELDVFLNVVAEAENFALIEEAFRQLWLDRPTVQPIYTEERWNTLYAQYFSRLPEAVVPVKRNVVLTARQRRYFTFAKIAASVAILVACTCISYYFLQKPGSFSQSKVAVQNNKSHTMIKPGGNNAILTLSNGQQFNLNSVAVGKITRQQNVSVAKTQDGQIIFKYDSSVKSNSRFRLPATTLNSISTPRGGKYQVDLPDGTHVWLNAASSLSFPTVFSGKTRTVKLDGEAYFEVAKNPNFPFVVESGNQKVKVLGTHFNISAYSDEQVCKTTLLEGKVEVSSGNSKVIIKPGQQTQLSGSGIRVAEVDANEAIDWKNGFIELDHEDIYEIMKKISRWYDVEVIYKGNISNIRFGGSVSRSADISKILAVLEATGAVHFKIEKRRIIVM